MQLKFQKYLETFESKNFFFLLPSLFSVANNVDFTSKMTFAPDIERKKKSHTTSTKKAFQGEAMASIKALKKEQPGILGKQQGCHCG